MFVRLSKRAVAFRFGHSREQASLFTKMGYDGMFFSRLDFRDKLQRRSDKSMETVWQSSDNLEDSDILTGVLFNHYSPPPGFCFDILCNDEPIIDDEYSADYNVDRRVCYIKYKQSIVISILSI